MVCMLLKLHSSPHKCTKHLCHLCYTDFILKRTISPNYYHCFVTVTKNLSIMQNFEKLECSKLNSNAIDTKLPGYNRRASSRS